MTGSRKSLSLMALVAGSLLAALALVSPSYAASAGALPRVTDQTCTDDTGVSVVVDASGVDGDVTQACVPATGEEPATDVLQQAGAEITPVGAFPGAVCQVDGLPADVQCAQMPSGNAYWGLFVTNDAGEWDYAPVGVDELRLAPGDAVGFAWQTSADPTPPGVEPGVDPAAAASESAEPQPNDGATISSTPGTDAGTSADTGVGDGTPVWIFYVVVVVVAVGGLVVVQLRRRSRK